MTRGWEQEPRAIRESFVCIRQKAPRSARTSVGLAIDNGSADLRRSPSAHPRDRSGLPSTMGRPSHRQWVGRSPSAHPRDRSGLPAPPHPARLHYDLRQGPGQALPLSFSPAFKLYFETQRNCKHFCSFLESMFYARRRSAFRALPMCLRG
jgi:hypothetical protein